jgi:hypothetical protein
MPAGPQSGSIQQNKSQRDSGEREGQIGSGEGLDVDDGKLPAFLAGKQLGFRHPMGEGVRWSIERELVSQPPTKDTTTQHHEAKGQAAQTFASTEDEALRLLR